MNKSLLALGTLVFLALVVLIAQKQQVKQPIALAHPAKVLPGKGEYMRPPSGSSSNFFAQPKTRVEADAKTAKAQEETLKLLGYDPKGFSPVTVSTKKQ